MGRSFSNSAILTGAVRQIDHTLDLVFPDASTFKFATAPLTISGRGTYTNDLETVSELRQTLESPVDRVGVGIQNVDRVLSLHIAANWQKWRRAEATLGRYYKGGDGLAATEWTEMFRGVVQQPNANDLHVTFDIIPDTTAPGLIVTNRTLGLPCPFVFKDPNTCGYSGPLTACNHYLRSPGGCEGRSNTHRFGGMEHRYNPDISVPGTGGNNDDGDGIVPCPRSDQFVRVRGTDGKREPKMAGFLTEEDWMWNPLTRRFHAIEKVYMVRNVPIFEIECINGARGFSSFSHRILWYRDHATGEPVEWFTAGDPVLCERKRVENSHCKTARDTGSRGDVIFIKMKDGHIYSYGDREDKMIVAHNSKQPLDDPPLQ